MIGMISAGMSALSALKGGGGGGSPVGGLGGAMGASSSAKSSADGRFDGAVTINRQSTNNAPVYMLGGVGLIVALMLIKKGSK